MKEEDRYCGSCFYFIPMQATDLYEGEYEEAYCKLDGTELRHPEVQCCSAWEGKGVDDREAYEEEYRRWVVKNLGLSNRKRNRGEWSF